MGKKKPAKGKGGFKEQLWTLLLEAVSRDNVLPLTSSCNLRCLFCSHLQNPPGVQTFSFAPLSEDWLKELIPLLDGSRKIIIGESSTRLCEGEPFTHPFFFEILKEIRRRFPRTPLQITTNGTCLTAEKVGKLASLNRPEQGAGIELIISLNSASLAQRSRIMGDPHPENVLRSLSLCRENGLSFHGSVVALPHLCGWEDLKETLYFLEEEGAMTTRVFLPGYTAYAHPSLRFAPSLWEELDTFLAGIREKIEHPLTLEPPVKKDLLAKVEGVIGSSPAREAGIKRGDLIVAVNGKKVVSGTDAFYRIQSAADPLVSINRPGRNEEVPLHAGDLAFRISKKAGRSSGLVFNADLHPRLFTEVRKAAAKGRGRPVLLLTSRVAAPLWEAAGRKGLLPEAIRISPVENLFFGGSICCAGLLTVADLRAHLEEVASGYGYPAEPLHVLVPLASFDRRGFDLCGEHYQGLDSHFPYFTFSFL
ncbi:MAG: radical SAM protein [Firmicutes bacterium]|nr:radical SAM protein [Bacillota bacterium]